MTLHNLYKPLIINNIALFTLSSYGDQSLPFPVLYIVDIPY